MFADTISQKNLNLTLFDPHLTLTQCTHLPVREPCLLLFSDDKTFNILRLLVLISEIHHYKVFIYVYLWFKHEFKENYLASSSLSLPLAILQSSNRENISTGVHVNIFEYTVGLYWKILSLGTHCWIEWMPIICLLWKCLASHNNW